MKNLFRLKTSSGALYEINEVDGVIQVSIDGKVVSSSPGVAVDSPAGGSTVDTEARASIDALISSLADAGVIEAA